MFTNKKFICYKLLGEEKIFKKQRAIESKSCLSDNQLFSSNTLSSKENDNNDREE